VVVYSNDIKIKPNVFLLMGNADQLMTASQLWLTIEM
jgi:hypothetical protein